MTENATETAFRPGDKALVLFSDQVRRLARLTAGFVWTADDTNKVVAAEGGFDAWPVTPDCLNRWAVEADEWFNEADDNHDRVMGDPDAPDELMEKAVCDLEAARLQLNALYTAHQRHFGNGDSATEEN